MAESKSFSVSEAIEQIKKDRTLALVVGGFALALIGLFFPWYEANVFGVRISSAPGLNSTGLLVAIASVVGGGAALNVLDKDVKQMRTVVMVSAIVAALVVLTNYPNDDLGSLVSVGIGYWLSAVGAIAAVVGSLQKK